MSDRPTLRITFSMTELRAKPRIRSNIRRDQWENVISTFLQTQIGCGKDDSPSRELNEYCITIHMDPSDDTFFVCHDCGNLGLRDGILLEVLSKLSTEDVVEET